jgi:hypothetical protein
MIMWEKTDRKIDPTFWETDDLARLIRGHCLIDRQPSFTLPHRCRENARGEEHDYPPDQHLHWPQQPTVWRYTAHPLRP